MQVLSNSETTQQIFFIDDLEKITGRNRLTLRRWWQSGKFPTPVKINGTTLAWHRDTIESWIKKTVQI